MPGDNLWLCITALAAIVDGSPAESDAFLDQMEIDLRNMDKIQRDAMRHRFSIIVAQLARIEVRMIETNGPVGRG